MIKVEQGCFSSKEFGEENDHSDYVAVVKPLKQLVKWNQDSENLT